MLCTVKMCFTCLGTNSKELVDVSKLDFDRITYLEKLKACVPSEFQDSSSNQICWPCIKQLRVSYRFREMVLLSQETIQKYVEQAKSSSEDSGDGKDGDDVLINSDLLEPKCEFITHEDNNDTGNIQENLISNRFCEEIKELLSERKRQQSDNIDLSNPDDSDSSDYFLADLKNPSDSEPVETGNFVCIKCNKSYANSLELDEHCCLENSPSLEIQNVHKNSDIKCRRLSSRPKRYLKKITTEVIFKCEHCDIIYNKRWKLQKHKARVHVEEKKYVCTYCNKGFKQSYHLREHITSHTGERNYTCSFCGKSFQRVSSMRRHVRSHEAAPGQKTKRTPFLCTVCGKSFPFSNGVQRHMRIHLGIKKHECDICHRKFTQSTHLHVHMRTHTGEKPYICHTCGEAFSLNASLQKHMTIHQNLTKDLSKNLVQDLSKELPRIYIVNNNN